MVELTSCGNWCGAPLYTMTLKGEFPKEIETHRQISINGVVFERKLSVEDVAFLGPGKLADTALKLLPVGSYYCYSDLDYVVHKVNEGVTEFVCQCGDLVGWKE